MSGAALEQAKAEAPKPLGLYVHVPFCASTCDFCAFYQKQPTADDVSRFLSGVEREAALVAWPRPLTTAFWGGGTPGLLAPKALARLAETVRSRLINVGGVPSPGIELEKRDGRTSPTSTPI